MNKLIFFDIDGTIIEEGGSYFIPDSTLTAFDKLKENGNLLYINSGRTKSEIENRILDTFPFSGLICGCGTYIEENENVLFSRNVSLELTKSIVRDLEKYNIEWLLEGKDYIYYSTNTYKSDLEIFRKQHLELVCDNTIIADPEKLIAEGAFFDKFCIWLTKDSDLKSFENIYSPYFEFIDRGEGFYEIVPLGASKADGMEFLMDYHNVGRDSTYAIGDSTNDISMLEFAGTSICMGNGAEDAKKTVDLVTDNLRDDGLYNAFVKLGLI
ncbi:MAG: HAD family hydrolase [Lachnospiraceae bacterium]|nr:HAD family hydrolase [Lachnospiraceae bacterium]